MVSLEGHDDDRHARRSQERSTDAPVCRGGAQALVDGNAGGWSPGHRGVCLRHQGGCGASARRRAEVSTVMLPATHGVIWAIVALALSGVICRPWRVPEAVWAVL